MSASDPFVHPAFRRWRVFGYGPNTEVGAFWRAQIEADPQLAKAVYCAELVFAGDVIVRVATERIETVEKATGRSIVWQAGLVEIPEVVSSYTLGTGTSAARSIAISLSTELVDLVAILDRGIALAGYGQLSLQIDGQEYEKRLVLITGDMDDGVTFGGPKGGALGISLTDIKEAADLNLTSYVVDEARVANISDGGPWDNAIGQRYPLVINRYLVPCLGLDTLLTSITYKKQIVCLGHGHTINAVYVDGDDEDDDGDPWTWTQEEVFDAYGVPITIMSVEGVHAWDQSESVHADVTAPPPTRSLLDVIVDLVTRFTTMSRAGISTEMLGLAQSKIGASNLIAMVNGSGEDDATTAIGFIESTLLAGFPMVSMAFDGSGYGPVVTDRRTVIRRARYTAGKYPIKDRVSDVTERPKSESYNDFSLSYGYDLIDSIYTKVVTRTADNDATCRFSRDVLHGPRPYGPIESVTIQDDREANHTIDWLVAHLAVPAYYVEYDCWPEVFVHLRMGDTISWSDSEFDWVDVTATVEKIGYAKKNAILGMWLWPTRYATPNAPSALVESEPDDDVDPGPDLIELVGTPSSILLLHFDNTGTPTTFIDSGSHTFAITYTADNVVVPQDTSNKVFGTGAWHSDAGEGSETQYLELDCGSAWDLGTSPDFIIDFWVFFEDGTNGSSARFFYRTGAGEFDVDTDSFSIGMGSDYTPDVSAIQSGVPTLVDAVGTALVPDVWNHVRYVFHNGQVAILQGVDGGVTGVVTYVGADTTDYSALDSVCRLARMVEYFIQFTGWIDEFYIASGVHMGDDIAVDDEYTLPTVAWT